MADDLDEAIRRLRELRALAAAGAGYQDEIAELQQRIDVMYRNRMGAQVGPPETRKRGRDDEVEGASVPLTTDEIVRILNKLDQSFLGRTAGLRSLLAKVGGQIPNAAMTSERLNVSKPFLQLMLSERSFDVNSEELILAWTVRRPDLAVPSWRVPAFFRDRFGNPIPENQRAFDMYFKLHYPSRVEYPLLYHLSILVHDPQFQPSSKTLRILERRLLIRWFSDKDTITDILQTTRRKLSLAIRQNFVALLRTEPKLPFEVIMDILMRSYDKNDIELALQNMPSSLVRLFNSKENEEDI